MQRYHLAALILATVIALLAALWTTSIREPSTDATSEALLVPGLREDVNRVSRVRLSKAGDRTIATLERGEQYWTVAESAGYPADMAKVRELLLDIAGARIVEQKTSNPDHYQRLGVEDPESDDAGSTRVDMEGLDQPVALIVGDTAGSRSGTYVRRVGEAASWLIDASLTIAPERVEWLNKQLLDIPSQRIQRVSITHPDGTTLVIEKDTHDQASFGVLDVPEGRSLRSEGVANPIGSALSGLQLDDAQPAAAVEVPEETAVHIEYRTFDGLLISAAAFRADSDRMVRFDIAFDGEQAARFAPEPEQPSESDTADSPAQSSGSDEPEPGTETDEATSSGETEADDADAKVREEATTLGARLADWTYTIPEYKHQQITRTMEDLLQTETEPE